MILSKSSADKKIRRMALEIAEHNSDNNGIIFIGIKENGVYIAEKTAEYLSEVFKGTVKIIALSISKKSPAEIILSEEISLKGKVIILADDVANSGRTMLYALRPLLDHYPARVETLALVERTHKLFPVALNYVGLSVSTSADENIAVIVENGEIMGAEIINK